MRIGIDVRYLSHGLTGGVHTYVYQFVLALSQLETDDQFYLYADTKQPFELKNLPSNFTLRLLPWNSGFDSIKNDLFMQRKAKLDRVDVIHFPANYGFGPSGTRTIITLHDAINIFPLWEATKRDLKKPKTIAQTLYLQFMTRASLPRASQLVTVSNHAAKNIGAVSKGKIPLSKIKVIYSAPAQHFELIHDQNYFNEVRKRLGLPNKFVLADGLKNPEVILRAWERVSPQIRNQYGLVFFSRRPNLLPMAMQAIRDGKVQHILRPTDSDLIAMYNMARLFLFPSWIEGFGLPILEAMACGTPVIASNRGSIPEIGGDAALYHDAEDDETLARLIQKVLESPQEYNQLKEQGIERARQFSWQRTAEEHYKVYHL